MNKLGCLGMGLLVSSGLLGCGAPVEGGPDTAEGPAANEEVGAVQQAIFPAEVGVVPMDGQACPAGTEVSFRLDVEDPPTDRVVIGCKTGAREGGYITAWVDRDVFWTQAPVTTSMCYHNFSMRFCRVDGNQFKRLLWGSNFTSYAVLQLSSACPEGSFAASRFMDMEDDDNTNTSSGSLAPSVIDRNANLKFCVFGNTLGGNGPIMYSFPTLGGLKYAVFHDYDLSPQQTWVMKKKFIWSDDEDHANINSRNPATGIIANALAAMIEGTTDTFIEMAQVR